MSKSKPELNPEVPNFNLGTATLAPAKVFILTVGDEITAVFADKPTFEQFTDHIVGIGSSGSEEIKSIPDLENYMVEVSTDGFYGEMVENTLLGAYKSFIEHWGAYIRCELWDLEYSLTEMTVTSK